MIPATARLARKKSWLPSPAKAWEDSQPGSVLRLRHLDVLMHPVEAVVMDVCADPAVQVDPEPVAVDEVAVNPHLDRGRGADQDPGRAHVRVVRDRRAKPDRVT